MDYRELYRTAQQVINNAYVPYSHFKVGAALLTKSGEVFTGVNVENATYGAAICAERTALVKAVSEGYREFDAIAVVSSDGEVYPCGICRQFIFEFGDNIKIITGEDEDHIKVSKIEDLLPKGFRLK